MITFRWQTALGFALAVAFGYGLATVVGFRSALRFRAAFNVATDACLETASQNGWAGFALAGRLDENNQLAEWECIEGADPQ